MIARLFGPAKYVAISQSIIVLQLPFDSTDRLMVHK